jgi:hypothetical protein
MFHSLKKEIKMICTGPSHWGGGAAERDLVQYSDERHRDRMGHCKWFPSDGDFCVCVKHSGDCFYSYMAIRKEEDGTWRKIGDFGAYVFGEKIGKIDEREFFLLQAGELVSLTIDKDQESFQMWLEGQFPNDKPSANLILLMKTAFMDGVEYGRKQNW